MSTSVQELEEKRKYTLGRIDYIEAAIKKYKINEGELDEEFCKEQIDFHEHSLIGYRRELFQIESQLESLGHKYNL